MEETFRCEGVYRIEESAFHGGEERFVYERGPEGVRYDACIAQHGEQPELRCRLELGDDFALRSMTLESSEQGGARRALVTREPHGLRVERSMPDGTPLMAVLPFDAASTELDWRSPIFNGVTCLRLALRDGEERVIDVRYFDPQTFAPTFMEQHYACEGREEIETPAGRFGCARYRYTVPHVSTPFWVTAEGLVVRYMGFCELISLI